MSIISQYSRLSHHTVTNGATFSVPTQEDFTLPSGASGSWTVTDLALSEIGVDEANNKAFIRIGSNINEFSFIGGTVSGATPSLDEVLVVGNTTGGSDIILSTSSVALQTQKIVSPVSSDTYFQFRDKGGNTFEDIHINSDSGSTIIMDSGVSISALGLININAGNTQGVQIENTVYRTATASTTDASDTLIITTPHNISDTMKYFKAKVTALQDDGSNGYYSEITSAIRNDGGTLNQVSTVDLIEKTDFTTATSTIDFSGTTVRVKINGEVGVNIDWRVDFEYNRS